MASALRPRPLLLLLLLLLAAASLAPGAEAKRAARTTPAPVRPTSGAQGTIIIDAPRRCPDGTTLYNGSCRSLRGRRAFAPPAP